jgi:hypothetical protein
MPIHRSFAALVLVAAATASGPLAAQSSQTQDLQADFSTPEGAILMLEDAYRRKDLDAVVAAKDFTSEARVMLSPLRRAWSEDAEVLKRTAEVLELAFRTEMKERWPDFSGIKSRFPHKEKYAGADDIVAVTEVCTFPDGGTSTQKLLVAKTPNGWRVLNVVQ